MVYRITQVVLPEVDGGEGPILPRDDWAESEILEGSNGWVQVSNNCLVRTYARSHPIVVIIPVSGTGAFLVPLLY